MCIDIKHIKKMKSKSQDTVHETVKERPLKGLKERMKKHAVIFKETSKNHRNSQEKLKNFKDLRKWDMELEKIDREELSIKNSLQEINNKIYQAVHRREMIKSLSQNSNAISIKEKQKINLSLSKIEKAIHKTKK